MDRIGPMSAPSDPLDPLQQLLGANLPETVDDMRRLLDQFAGLMNAGAPEVGAHHEHVLVREVDGARVTADVVVPKGDGPHPVLVYFHGGGWICGSPATHRKLAHRFAEAGYLVMSVDYRLAPEHPFPAPFDDCVDAIRWAAREAPHYGGDPSRLAVGGDSAGGNLSAASAIALAGDRSAPAISAALLIYGVFDFAAMGDMAEGIAVPDPSLAEAGRRMVEMMVGAYLGPDRTQGLLADPRVSPIHGAAKLPPSHVVAGGADPLSAQARALVAALEASGVAHEHVELEGMPHGFVQMEFFPQARESIDRMVKFLDRYVR
jgi:acetyl esterase